MRHNTGINTRYLSFVMNRYSTVKEWILNFNMSSIHDFHIPRYQLSLLEGFSPWGWADGNKLYVHVHSSMSLCGIARKVLVQCILNTYSKGDKFSLSTSEDLSNLKWLRQEPCYFTCTSYSELVILRQLVHTKNSNDILKRFVILKCR